MDRTSFVLAAMSPANGSPFSPVQVQKLFFLLDQNVTDHIGDGAYFQFKPYDYGPFDPQVYRELEEMEVGGLAEIHDPPLKPRTYRLTEKGQERGAEALAEVPESIRLYISSLVDFVRSQSFTALVSAIYRAYPDMKVNSVFVKP